MNANKLLALTFFSFGFLFAGESALAQQQSINAAPALYGVQEFQVQHGRIANSAASGNCGTSSGEIANMVIKALKGDGINAFSVLGAPPAKQGTARVDVFPDVVTLQPRDKECVSWVSITVQSKDLLRVFPVDTPRNLITTYWTGGLMVGSGTTAHPVALNDAVTKLTSQFSRQYRLDQPPSFSASEPAKEIPKQQ